VNLSRDFSSLKPLDYSHAHGTSKPTMKVYVFEYEQLKTHLNLGEQKNVSAGVNNNEQLKLETYIKEVSEVSGKIVDRVRQSFHQPVVIAQFSDDAAQTFTINIDDDWKTSSPQVSYNTTSSVLYVHLGGGVPTWEDVAKGLVRTDIKKHLEMKFEAWLEQYVAKWMNEQIQGDEPFQYDPAKVLSNPVHGNVLTYPTMDNYLYTPQPKVVSEDVVSPMIRFLKYAGLDPDSQDNSSGILMGSDTQEESTSLTKMIVICTVRTGMEQKYRYGTQKTTEYADRINYKSMTSKTTFSEAREAWKQAKTIQTEQLNSESGKQAESNKYLEAVRNKLKDEKYGE